MMKLKCKVGQKWTAEVELKTAETWKLFFLLLWMEQEKVLKNEKFEDKEKNEIFEGDVLELNW